MNIVFEASSLVNTINVCTTTGWPNILAHMVVKKFKKEYKPDEKDLHIELRRELGAIVINDIDNPNDLFDKL